VLDGMSAATFTGNFTLANTSGPGPWSLSLGTGAEAGDVILNYTLLAGDVNGDGFVNQLDLNVVSGHWQAGPGATLPQGDANGDGFVNQLDLNVISGHWQAVASGFALTSYSTAPVVAAVPEPGSFVLLGGVSLLALAGYRRRLTRKQA
jgi:hypothetical protein